MSKNDLFTIILKIFGIYYLIYFTFQYLPSLFGIASYDVDGMIYLHITTTFACILFICFMLLFNTKRIIKWLKLDKGFDEKQFSIVSVKSTEILPIAIFVLGGYMFISNLPEFLINFYLGITKALTNKAVNAYYTALSTEINFYNWGLSALNLVIGFLTIVYYRQVTAWLISNGK